MKVKRKTRFLLSPTKARHFRNVYPWEKPSVPANIVRVKTEL